MSCWRGLANLLGHVCFTADLVKAEVMFAEQMTRI